MKAPPELPCPGCDAAVAVTTLLDLARIQRGDPLLLGVACPGCGRDATFELERGRARWGDAAREVRGLDTSRKTWGVEVRMRGRTWRMALPPDPGP